MDASAQRAETIETGHAEDKAPLIVGVTGHRDLVMDEVPGIVLHSAGAGMFVVVDVRGLGVDGRTFAQGFLDQHDVAVLPCDGFGASGAGLLRVSVCEPEDRLREACARLRDYIAARGWERRRNEPAGAGTRRRPFDPD